MNIINTLFLYYMDQSVCTCVVLIMSPRINLMRTVDQKPETRVLLGVALWSATLNPVSCIILPVTGSTSFRSMQVTTSRIDVQPSI